MKHRKVLLLVIFCASLALPLVAAPARAADLNAAVSEVFGNEGGLQCRKDDQGNIGLDGTYGCTNWGVTHRDYPRLDIRHLTRDDAARKVYLPLWHRLRLDQARSDINADEIFDGATNMGEPFESRLMQEAINLSNGRRADITVDGRIGPATIREFNRADQVLLYINLIGLRYDRYKFLATENPRKYGQFFQDWLKRVGHNVIRAVHQYEAHR